MEHRGIEYQIVQTANPKGWRWIARLSEHSMKSGTSNSSGNAIFKALRAIDIALGPKVEELKL